MRSSYPGDGSSRRIERGRATPLGLAVVVTRRLTRRFQHPRKSTPKLCELGTLGQIVRDLKPLRFRANEDVLGRANAGCIDKRPHCHVHVCAFSYYGKKERATHRAARVIQVLLAHDQQALSSGRDLELLAFDTGERFERRTSRCATTGAVAVRRVQKLIGNLITDQATLALSREHALVPFASGRRRCTHLHSLLILFDSYADTQQANSSAFA